MTRREFTHVAALAAAGLALPRPLARAAEGAAADNVPPVHIFSKHLQFLGLAEMARVAADLGFAGVDLTVRRGGHVEPAEAGRDLPRAAAALRQAGLEPDMFVSTVADPASPADLAVLEAAAGAGFKTYRTGYLSFTAGESWRSSLQRHKATFEQLARVNERLGLHGAYQNHAGTRVGAYLPDLAFLLEGLDPRWVGCQFDIRHAVVEGATAWPAGLGFLAGHIRTIAVKDFRWEQSAGGLRVVDVPLGEGVVDFVKYFKLLRHHGVRPVISLHLEYELGGADGGRRELTIPREQVYAAMTRDLAKVRELWRASA